MLWFGIDRYLLNWRFFGHPLGDEQSFSLFASETNLSLWGRFGNMLENIERTAFNAVFGDLEIGAGDFLERLLPVLQSRDPDIGSGRPLLFGLPWYGTFTMAILATGLLALIFRIKRDSNPTLLILLVPGVSTLLLMHWVRPNYSLAFSRYMLGPLALGFAVAAFGLPQVARRSQRMRQGLGALMVVVVLGASWQAVNAATMNGIRPLSGRDHVWGKSATELLSVSNGFRNAGVLAELVDRIDSCFEPTVDMKFAIGTKFPQGSLFGEDFQRMVTQYKFPKELLSSDLMAENGEMVMVVDALTLEQWYAKWGGHWRDVLLAGVPAGQLRTEFFGSYILVIHAGVDGVGCAEEGQA
jgi:hypothetical protein